jgi:zinc transport system ATP-binding protein
MNDIVLSAKNLTIGYNGIPLLPPVNVTIKRGEFWAVVGRNGSGKTTLVRTLLGLHEPLGGSIDRSADYLPSYVPQRAALDPIVPLRVTEVVALGMDRGWGFVGGALNKRRETVHRALRQAGADELYKRQFQELSEGQKQRVLLARVLAAQANIAYLDEPTAAMDSVAERQSLETIDRLRNEHNMAVVIVSHFLGVARDIADRVLFLDRELQVSVSGAAGEVFQSDAFRQRYGDIGAH